MKLSKIALFLTLTTCSHVVFSAEQPKDASAYTRAMNNAVYKESNFHNQDDFQDAAKGFIATLTPMMIKDSAGNISWDMESYGFIKGDAPDTVNPSLWRIAKLNMLNGLFKVTDSVYQIRGFDLSDMTIIEGDKGIIIIDPLVTTEVASAGLKLYYQHRPFKPVVAVIYTHSHADHYGGVRGVVDEKDIASGKVTIIAPDGFMKEAVSENVLAGTAMSRRTLYQYGAMLPRSARGQIDAGLGKTTSIGTFTLIPPTDTVRKTGEKRVIAGVEMQFQMAQDTEAPAEMLIWFPQFKMLDTAEDATHTLHNIYTLRGAQVRDASSWWKVLNLAINEHLNNVEIVIAQHQWPTWGNQKIISYLSNQRDMFKFIHDQTLNLVNKGLTMNEIAETLTLPPGLANEWYNRGYYGSVSHNAKAVYQRYIGWYDSNPADLNPLPPSEAAKKYVEFMGGENQVLEKARKSIAAGEYRWAAEVLKHVVFSDPTNQIARNLQADAFEQLGYQSENATWRNEYLMGAYELRNGVPDNAPINTASIDMVRAMDPELILDYMGVRLNAEKALNKNIVINWQMPDGTVYGIELKNSVILYNLNRPFPQADVLLKTDKTTFSRLFMQGEPLDNVLKSSKTIIEGNQDKVIELQGMLDIFPGMFKIVTP